MKTTFLGTGTSHGVPSIDCMLDDHARCRKGVCEASRHDPRHARTRCSLYVEHEGRGVLLDVSPDFRVQALRERIARIDAVLLTHHHMDHIGGIPDLRSYTREYVPVYGTEETIGVVKTAFAYAFDPATFVGGGIPRLKSHIQEEQFTLFGLEVTPIPVEHGVLRGCCGFRLNSMAYVPDMKRMDERWMRELYGLDVLVLNCLRDERPHSTHMILQESMALARELRPRRCYFVHMCHDIHYVLDSVVLEPWMAFAWDGLMVEAR
jgi:phosphoribosyl 1,2-cyclic phosphate phosphodiesterase